MTEEFETAGISTGLWWNSPLNTSGAVFSDYSLPRSTETSLDITNFTWQDIDNKINDHNDHDIMNIFFEGLFDPNEQLQSDSWPKNTIPNAKSEFIENFSVFDDMFLIDSEAESFFDHDIRNNKSNEQVTQACNNVTSKALENTDEYSKRLYKRPRIETLTSLPSFKVRKEKLGDRVTALQQLVSPFGKTDTASVLNEAIEYIKFLQEQVTVLCNPDQSTIGYVQQQQCSYKKPNNTTQEECGSRRQVSTLASRGLCLMPISASYPMAAAAASAAEINTYEFLNLPSYVGS
ncbi:unnamed protein product [Cochlearia groenlandica]